MKRILQFVNEICCDDPKHDILNVVVLREFLVAQIYKLDFSPTLVNKGL